MDIASVAIRLCALRIDLDGLGAVGDGHVVVPLGPIGRASAKVRICILGVDLNGLVVIGDGRVVVPLGVIGHASVEEAFSVRVKFQTLIVVRNCKVMLS